MSVREQGLLLILVCGYRTIIITCTANQTRVLLFVLQTSGNRFCSWANYGVMRTRAYPTPPVIDWSQSCNTCWDMTASIRHAS